MAAQQWQKASNTLAFVVVRLTPLWSPPPPWQPLCPSPPNPPQSPKPNIKTSPGNTIRPCPKTPQPIQHIDVLLEPSNISPLQKEGNLSVIYQAVREGRPLTKQQVATSSQEIRKLNGMFVHLRRQNGLLQAKVVLRVPRWLTLCPKVARQTVIWETHSQAHQGRKKTKQDPT